jgi:hypothetical protein
MVRKSLLTLFAAFFCCASLLNAQDAAASNPSLASQDAGFILSPSVDTMGNKYIGYGGELPSVMTFVNADGTISVCASDARAQKTYIYEYTQEMKLAKTMTFSNERAELGAFTKDSDGAYYFFFAENAGKNADNMAMVKYDKDGKKLKSYSLSANAQNSMAGIQVPFDASTCRLELSGQDLAVYFGRQMFNGHQASYGFVLDKDSFERVDKGATTNPDDAGRKIMPYVSHSFNQFILPVENGFLFADHGDAYPRSFTFALWQTNNRTHRLNAFTFPGATGQNATYAEMGGLAPTSTGYIFCATYGNGSQSVPRNVMIMTFDKALKAITVNKYITSYSKNDGHAGHPKIAALGKGRYIVMWELFDYSTQSANQIVSTPTGFKAAYMMLVDEKGNALSPAKKLPAGIRLNMDDVLRYNPLTGRVYWAVNIGSTTIALYGLDPEKDLNFKVNLSSLDRPVVADASMFQYSTVGQGNAQYIRINKYTGSVTKLIIPDKINNLPVREIGSGAFTYSPVSSVTLPSTLTTIDDTAFWYSGIVNLVIPEGVTFIGKQAFSYCPALVKLSLPASLKTVKEFAFMGCPKLSSVSINQDCDMSLGYGAFQGCPLDAASKSVVGTY